MTTVASDPNNIANMSSIEASFAKDREAQKDNTQQGTFAANDAKASAGVSDHPATPPRMQDAPSYGGSNGSAPAPPTPEVQRYVTFEPSTKEPGAASATRVDILSPPSESPARDPEVYARDIRAAFGAVPRVRPQWQDRYMKLLVVGESGLGKTTFIKNLFAAYAQDPALKVNDASAPTSRDTFIQSPAQLCTEIVVRDEATMQAFHYNVQDTPGYDNMEDNMECILEYIRTTNQQFLELEQDVKRNRDLARTPDPRVDVCLYFISPHRIKPVDVRFIKELSQLVPLVPVLAKADCMTSDELAAFRTTVRRTLDAAGKGEGRTLYYNFKPEAMQEASIGVRHPLPPFAVVASNTSDLSVGKFWPVRKYPWGICECLSTGHSDLAALKKLLFELSYLELKDQTDSRYHAFRNDQLMNLDGRPVHRNTLTEQLARVNSLAGHLRQQAGAAVHLHPPKRGGMRRFFGSVLRVVASGAALYIGVNFALGGRKHGLRRLREDAHLLQEKTAEAASQLVEVVESGAEKVKEVVSNHQDTVKDAVVGAGSAALETAEKAKDAAVRAGAAAKDKVTDVLSSAEDRAKAEAERVKKAQEAERAKRRWGPMALFRRGPAIPDIE